MDNSGVIYIITNKINKKQYIGQAVSYFSNGKVNGSMERWKTHVSRALRDKSECRLLENAIKKYGPDTFIVEDLLICNMKDLNMYEDKFINLYNTLYPSGYNLMTGGGNGRKHSIESRQLMSKSRTGKVFSKETKERMSKSLSGKPKSQKARENTAKSSRWRNLSEEHVRILENSLNQLNMKALPMYIGYISSKNGIVVKMPNCPKKCFYKQEMNLTEKIKLAIEHKNYLLQRMSVKNENSSLKV